MKGEVFELDAEKLVELTFTPLYTSPEASLASSLVLVLLVSTCLDATSDEGYT